MAITEQATDAVPEYCPSCRVEQPHEVSVELVTESDERQNAAYSREPYRVSECRICGRRRTLRMNDA